MAKTKFNLKNYAEEALREEEKEQVPEVVFTAPAKPEPAPEAAAVSASDAAEGQGGPERRRPGRKKALHETKSVRTSVNMTPSLRKKVDEAIDDGRLESLNDFVSRSLEAFFSGRFDPYA